MSAAPGAVILETSRLVLREITRDPQDLDFAAAMLGDPEVMRFYPHPLSREEAAAWVERAIARYARDGHGLWQVVEKETGARAGHVGLAMQEVDGAWLPEVGYLLHRPFWKKGYATEAACASRDYGFARGYERIISLVRVVNLPSAAVARRMGMEVEGHTERAGFDHYVFATRKGRKPGR